MPKPRRLYNRPSRDVGHHIAVLLTLLGLFLGVSFLYGLGAGIDVMPNTLRVE